MPNPLEQFNVVFFYKQTSYHEDISEKKQLQVQTIKRTVTGIKESQYNGTINNFSKGCRWFYRQCLRTVCHCLRPESRK